MRQDQPDIRQRILETGESIISGKGFSAVGLAEILTASKVPKGSFYYYFESKEQFGEALLETYFSDYMLRLNALLGAPAVPARDRLMAYWQRWVEVQSQEPDSRQCLVVKLSAEVSDLSETMRRVLQKGTDQVLARLETCLKEGRVDGSLPADLDATSTAHALYQLWLGASLLAKVGRDGSPFERAMQTTRTWLGLDDTKSR
jgi:TetR/AcrR family transcriptional repressor of nem operon